MLQSETTGHISRSMQDKETGLLVKSSPRLGRNAATQTPEIIRYPTPTRRSPFGAQYPTLSSSDESLVYEDSISYHPPVRNAEVSRGMPPIPDVIVEYHKDNLPLTQEKFNSIAMEQSLGITNLAFEGKHEIVRGPSMDNFCEKPSAYHSSNTRFLHPVADLLVPNTPSDPRTFSTANVNRRLYYSLPKSPRRKQLVEDLKIHSQPPTPQMNRERAVAIDVDNSNFWIIPRVHSSTDLNQVPPPTSNYPNADNIAGLYTINGRSTVVSNGFSEPVISLYDNHLMPPVGTSAPPAPKSVKKFEFTKMPPSVDRKRRSLQLCTESFSLLFFIPGILIAVFTPLTVIPLFYVAQKHYIPHILIFLGSGTLSVVLLVFAGIIGNLVWHYDDNSKKLRLRMHCGKGPTFHFWGNIFYNAGVENKEKQQKELIV